MWSVQHANQVHHLRAGTDRFAVEVVRWQLWMREFVHAG